MSRRPSLNQDLLAKIALKKKKALPYIRQQISKKANRQNLTPEAAQLVWAKQLGINIATALRGVQPQVQDQVRTFLSSSPAKVRGDISKPLVATPASQRPGDALIAAADYLLVDADLRSRCIDLLRRRKHLDRVMREATVVLEDRIRTLAGITAPLKPEDLVNHALNPERAKTILLYGTQPSEQQGFHSVCRGIVLAFRHKAHHRLTEDITPEEALKFCGFVDVLLQLLSTTTRQTPPTTAAA